MSDTPAADARDGAWLRLSDEAQRREPHALRSLVPLLADPDCVWLAGGTPHPRCVPLRTVAGEAGTCRVCPAPFQVACL